MGHWSRWRSTRNCSKRFSVDPRSVVPWRLHEGRGGHLKGYHSPLSKSLCQAITGTVIPLMEGLPVSSILTFIRRNEGLNYVGLLNNSCWYCFHLSWLNGKSSRSSLSKDSSFKGWSTNLFAPGTKMTSANKRWCDVIHLPVMTERQCNDERSSSISPWELTPEACFQDDAAFASHWRS